MSTRPSVKQGDTARHLHARAVFRCDVARCLCARLTFLHKARFRGTRQFPAVATYCFGRTGVPLALVYEACPCGTDKRLAALPDRFAFAGFLRHGRPNCECRQQHSKQQPFHGSFPLGFPLRHLIR